MAEDGLFRWIALAVIVSMFAISIYFRHRADKAGGRVSRADEAGPIRIGLGLSGLMGFGGLLLYLVWPPALSWTMVAVPDWLRWAGVALAVVGAAGAWWIFSTLGNNVTRTAHTREHATLVTTGPYRVVRHPLYVNAALVFAALSLVTRSWWFVVWIVPALVLLSIRTRTEEANLEARFGDAWRAYAARTGRFLPKVALMK
jgi:protein-S-isoprenylcysteine O-methyltransferase Ste14